MSPIIKAKKQSNKLTGEDISDVKGIIRQTTSQIVQEIGECSGNNNYSSALSKYVSVSNSLLKPYKHHLGFAFDAKKAERRFRVESVLLRLISEVARKHVQLLGVRSNHHWPIDRPDNAFGWYQLPEHYSRNVRDLSKLLLDTPNPELMLSEISGDVLSDAGDSIIGEFYTPINIADHLLFLSGITPQKIVSGEKVIDPACGAGIILLRLFSQLATSEKEKLSPQEIIAIAANNIWGFDIQPFATEITKTLLLYSSLIFFGEEARTSVDIYQNIHLRDTLATNKQYWENSPSIKNIKGFDFIIGNPPYMTVKSSDIPNIDSYSDVISGHPNLFQMFIWWAIRAAKNEGKISFLIPQSMLSGIYYKNLRSQIQKHASIRSITRLTHSKGVIGNADIQMMAISLEKSEAIKENKEIQIRVSQNGGDINNAVPFSIQESKAIKKFGNNQLIWIIGGSLLDYEILQKIDQGTTLIGNSLLWSIGNGNFVWNQNKEQLRKTKIENCLPLISATSIKKFNFVFPYEGNHRSKNRQFSILTAKLSSLKLTGPVLLIQRTTPHKFGHRIVAAIPPASFFERYPHFFLENHVNYISNTKQSISQLNGMLGWLNSDLFNYIFLIRNGTNIVSINELKFLPINNSILNDLAQLTKKIIDSTEENRVPLLDDLNEFIFNKFSLSVDEIQRIKSVLNRKEKA